MNDSTPTDWITYQKIPLHDGRVVVVQKRDGSTRTIILQRPTGATRRSRDG